MRVRLGLPESIESLEADRLDDPKGVIRRLHKLFRTLPIDDLAAAAGIYGSCWRQLGDYGRAFAAIHRGLVFAERGELIWDEANLFQRRSIVHAARGDFELAFRDSKRSLAAYVTAGDLDRTGTALVDQGAFYYHQMRFSGSRLAFQNALKLLAKNNVQNRFTSHNGLSLTFIETGKTERCLEHLGIAKTLVKALPQSEQVRFHWTEGKLAIRANRPDLAEAAFREAVRFFFAAGLVLDAVIATVELTRTLLAQGKTQEALDEARSSRRFLFHLSESSSAAAIVEAVCRQAETRTLTDKFLLAAAERLDGGRRKLGARCGDHH